MTRPINWKQQLHRLQFFVVDAWDEWRHSPGVNLLAVATLASALFLAGLVTLVLGNVENRVNKLRSDIRVQVFLVDDIEDDVRLTLGGELAGMQGVARVDYVNKQQALERYRDWAGDTARLTDELETNPLPASFEVFLLPRPGAEQIGAGIARRLNQREGVDEARFDRQWVHRLETVLELARVGGGGMALLVFSAVAFVMASVLRLAVYARRDEIEIMLLVGATPAFVRGPYLVAGVAMGLASSTSALLLVEGARRGALAYAAERTMIVFDLLAQPMRADHAGLLIGVGLLVSLTGSYFAVRRTV